MESKNIYPELKRIEADLQALRIMLVKSRKMPRKIAKLEGALKRVRVEEEDIEEAKKSVFAVSV